MRVMRRAVVSRHRSRAARALLLAACLSIACGPALVDDAGSRADAGLARDAGADDAGAPRDAGYDVDAGAVDAGAGDAGVPRDAGDHVDAGTLDAGAVDAGEPVDGGAVDAGIHEAVAPLVIVTLNAHAFQEGETSLEKLSAIGAGLAALDADIVGLNEMMSGAMMAFGGAMHDATEIVRLALESSSGAPWYAVRQGFAHWDTGEEMANAILSRTPLVDFDHRFLPTTDFWPAPVSSRNVVYARTVVPGRGAVNIFVTHTWGWDSVDTVPQIAAVKTFMSEKHVGDEALEILLGDLNMPSVWVEYETWTETGPFTLVDTFAVALPQSFTLPSTVDGTLRIDYVLARAGVAVVDESHFTSARVFDGNASFGVTLPIVSDHYGFATRFWP